MTTSQTTSQTTTTPQGAPDPRPHFERAGAQLEALIATVRPEQLGNPTPCAEWDVRALLGHLVDGAQRYARLGETGGDTGDAAAMEAPAGLDGIPDDGWAAAYAEARAAVSAAWSNDAKLDVCYVMPWGEVPGRGALSGCLLDTVTHTWDLAQGLGDRRRLEEEPAVFTLAFAHRTLPAERRGGPTPFAPPRPAPEGADVYAELAAWLGREAVRPVP